MVAEPETQSGAKAPPRSAEQLAERAPRRHLARRAELAAAACHFSDSFRLAKTQTTSSAGNMPIKNTSRHWCGPATTIDTSAATTTPPMPEAWKTPPATAGALGGKTSATSAVATAHSPATPTATKNRRTTIFAGAGGKVVQPAEDRVHQDAPDHGLPSAEAVGEHPEEQSAHRSAHEERREGPSEYRLTLGSDFDTSSKSTMIGVSNSAKIRP